MGQGRRQPPDRARPGAAERRDQLPRSHRGLAAAQRHVPSGVRYVDPPKHGGDRPVRHPNAHKELHVRRLAYRHGHVRAADVRVPELLQREQLQRRGGPAALRAQGVGHGVAPRLLLPRARQPRRRPRRDVPADVLRRRRQLCAEPASGRYERAAGGLRQVVCLDDLLGCEAAAARLVGVDQRGLARLCGQPELGRRAVPAARAGVRCGPAHAHGRPDPGAHAAPPRQHCAHAAERFVARRFGPEP
mmetsp:Transcript_11350/g.35291  ORF Transcript_11350/g.35291 Transcript_11350/m.35291 type:complete len:246 (-) Transcript_11350:802-1539(-)